MVKVLSAFKKDSVFCWNLFGRSYEGRVLYVGPPLVSVFIEHNGIGDRDLGNPVINELDSLPGRSVVTPDRWKLNLCAGDQCELFDLNRDPYEETNLFNHSAQKDRIRRMAAKVRLWQREVGDDALLPNV